MTTATQPKLCVCVHWRWWSSAPREGSDPQMTRQVSLTADGDDPFADMKAMLSAYDYDPDDVAEIHVEIELIEDTEDTDETGASLTVTKDTLAAQCLDILKDPRRILATKCL